jgi:hypothetical protein
MKRYSQHQIEALLDKFMDGQTTVEEETLLAEYFRSHDVPAEWEDYRDMFGYFDCGMQGDLPVQQPQAPLTRLMGRRWWGIAAAACITAAIVVAAMLRHSSTTSPQQPTVITQNDNDTLAPPPVVEVAPQQLAEASPEHPAPQAHPARQGRSASRSRNLKAENARLARENERLQRELADLKRRSFIIDLEANGFRAVQDEDGNIVLIDLEQELENELNNKLTTNIPAL